MTTKKATSQGSLASHPVEHMPPLNVTTQGIPAQEHLPTTGQSPTESRARKAAWTIVIACILVVVASVTVLVATGLNSAAAAGLQYRPSGERGYVAVWHVNHVG